MRLIIMEEYEWRCHRNYSHPRGWRLEGERNRIVVLINQIFDKHPCFIIQCNGKNNNHIHTYGNMCFFFFSFWSSWNKFNTFCIVFG